MTEFEPMDVHRVKYAYPGGGSMNSPVPELDQDWSNTDKLRWLASLVEYTTGVRCRINDGAAISGPGYDLRYPDYFGLHVGEPGRQSSVSGDYDRMWDRLVNIELGAMAARRSLGLAEHNPPRIDAPEGRECSFDGCGGHGGRRVTTDHPLCEKHYQQWRKGRITDEGSGRTADGQEKPL